tara:strand:- start:3199 stop:3513 length:315 start_codon:yes stop_codon:yes gene_type:complete
MDLLKKLEMINKEAKIDLSHLNITELEKVIYDANFLIKRKKINQFKLNKETAEKKLKVLDVVRVTGSKFKGEFFEVIKLNTKKVKCLRENGETWNIPYSCILMN